MGYLFQPRSRCAPRSDAFSENNRSIVRLEVASGKLSVLPTPHEGTLFDLVYVDADA